MNRLEAVLKELKISQSEFADMQNVGRQYINKICKNKAQPSLKTINRCHCGGSRSWRADQSLRVASNTEHAGHKRQIRCRGSICTLQYMENTESFVGPCLS